MESKPWTIYWFSQGQKKEHLYWMRETQFRETPADNKRIKYNTNGTNTGSSKTLICSKSREDTAESSGAARLSSKSLLQMHERENYCKQTWEKNQTSWNIG